LLYWSHTNRENNITARQEVVRFCKEHNIALNGKGGIPLLTKGEALECFDGWEEARSFLIAQRNAHQIGQRSVWL
jgi:hypothetical protein